MFAQHPKKINKLSSLFTIIEILSCGLHVAYNNKGSQLSCQVDYFENTRETPLGVAYKTKKIWERVDSVGQ